MVNALCTLGKPIVVDCHSGRGKTEQVVNKRPQLYESGLRSRGVTAKNFDQNVADAFGQIGPNYKAARTSTPSGPATGSA
jgi:hypothetical protein